LPKKKEKTRQIVSFYFLILHSPSHWVKQTISKKKKMMPLLDLNENYYSSDLKPEN